MQTMHKEEGAQARSAIAHVAAATKPTTVAKVNGTHSQRSGRASVASNGKGSKGGAGATASKASSEYKNAVCDLVKEELGAAFKRGKITKEDFKSIAKRATDKVVSTSQVCHDRCPAVTMTLAMHSYFTSHHQRGLLRLCASAHVPSCSAYMASNMTWRQTSVQDTSAKAAMLSEEKRSKICRLVSRYIQQASK